MDISFLETKARKKNTKENKTGRWKKMKEDKQRMQSSYHRLVYSEHFTGGKTATFSFINFYRQSNRKEWNEVF